VSERLPEDFVNKYRPKAADLTVFGIKAETLSHDELLAALAMASEEWHRLLEDEYGIEPGVPEGMWSRSRA